MLQNLVEVSFGGTPGKVVWSGLSPGSVGLYQINVEAPEAIIPPGLDVVPVAVTVRINNEPAPQVSLTIRFGPGQWLSEAVATFGLLLTIFGCLASAPASVPYAVGLYITAAYWFTASTSFANPAVTVARSLSDTFAGIAPAGVPAFIVAQLAGTLAAVMLSHWLWREPMTA